VEALQREVAQLRQRLAGASHCCLPQVCFSTLSSVRVLLSADGGSGAPAADKQGSSAGSGEGERFPARPARLQTAIAVLLAEGSEVESLRARQAQLTKEVSWSASVCSGHA
jgi:hypothetical protein